VGSRLMAARPDVSSTDLDSSHDAALPRSVTGGVLTDSGPDGRCSDRRNKVL
jgi:hypothetical protein